MATNLPDGILSGRRKWFGRRMPRWAMLPVLALGLQVGAQRLLADVRPQALIGEGMVLQQQRDVPLWGTADPGERVKVEFRRQQAEPIADQSGRWSVMV